MALNYTEQLRNLISGIMGVFQFVFSLLVGIPIGIASSAVRLKIGGVTTYLLHTSLFTPIIRS